jgi:hypothetical protein
MFFSPHLIVLRDFRFLSDGRKNEKWKLKQRKEVELEESGEKGSL